jgi:uncharacterized membrane protein
MLSLTSVIRIIVAIGAAVLAAEPALALEAVPTVPAPIVGAGIPALMAIGASYWALRKRRKR